MEQAGESPVLCECCLAVLDGGARQQVSETATLLAELPATVRK